LHSKSTSEQHTSNKRIQENGDTYKYIYHIISACKKIGDTPDTESKEIESKEIESKEIESKEIESRRGTGGDASAC